MKDEKTEKEDRALLEGLLTPFLEEFGHEALKALYHLNNEIRRLTHSTKFPIYTLYYMSLDKLLETEYKSLTTEEVAKAEGLKRRCAFRTVRRYYQRKRTLNRR